jgi:hypothetical protein
MLRHSASALLMTLLLAGCADSATQLPATTKILDEMPRVQNSTKAPCWLQMQISAQNSYVDSIRFKAVRVYTAPCKFDKSPQQVASVE